MQVAVFERGVGWQLRGLGCGRGEARRRWGEPCGARADRGYHRAMAAPDRHAFREHPLDGAMLYFQPRTGVHVRVERAATAGLRRRAPRVAMFGITNACNLACEFCSRDTARASRWTVADAAAALRGMHDAGTLEVAYGGGEPFAFRGFAELVAELDETTTLAQHVTTNGTLIHAATWSRFAGRFGQVRMSIYEGRDWRPAAEILAGARQRWGANRIVDAAALATLPALLAELAARGCGDVSLLSYVGPEPARHLDAAGAARLAAIIADSPIACRLSVCFGDRVPVPRLTDGDCGAGRDFLSITPDRRVQGCSFQDRSLPGGTADEILAAWRLHQVQLAAPAVRRGCARLAPAGPASPSPPIAIWQAFSGNNSGECIMVAKFATVGDAEAYLAALIPAWQPDAAAYPPAWRQLFADEGVLAADVDTRTDDLASPRELVAIGRSVLATQEGLGDTFPELRALAWKRGAFVVPGGVHCHGTLSLLAAIRAADRDDRARLTAELGHVHVHGDVVLFATPVAAASDALVGARDALVRHAADRPLAAELCEEVTDAAIVAALQRLGQRPATARRLWVTFWGDERDEAAAAFARMLPGDRVTQTGSTVLIDPAPDRKRLAVLACRRGGQVSALDGEVCLTAVIWFAAPGRAGPRAGRRVEVAELDAALRGRLAHDCELTIEVPDHVTYRDAPEIKIVTDRPRLALVALADAARALGARLDLWAAVREPIAAAVRRLVDDVRD
jgi:hypothetical protein